jgi:DNA mismatch endonuclease, patch repair protein
MRRRWFSTPEISRRMKLIRSSHTGLEAAMRKLLRQSGIQFRSQPLHFGKPDFWIVGTRILLFCDSSFWHGRSFKATQFSRNRELWVTKMRKNVQRDKAVTRRLRRLGWKVLRFWDNEIVDKPEEVIAKIKTAIPRSKLDAKPSSSQR